MNHDSDDGGGHRRGARQDPRRRVMSGTACAGRQPASAAAGGTGRGTALARLEAALAVAAFAVLCAVALTVTPQLTADGYAYRASIIAMTDGHFLTLSTAEVQALAAQLDRCPPSAKACQFGGNIEFWVQLPDGRWISEKDPGYPFLAAPFQLLGIIRLAPLFYGMLGCLGLFFGARRWLGRFGGAAAVGLFCSSGAALLFAWQDYWPTFTDASLIAAGTGTLLWALLADEATARRRTWLGLLGFASIEAAVFVRYTDIVVLGCAVAAVSALRWLRAARLPPGALGWWLGSVALSGTGAAVFDDLAYGGPLRSGYRPGEVTFSLAAVSPNLRYVPAHLIQAMPMLVPGLAALAWITARRVRLRRAGTEPRRAARRDFAVSLALAASWFSVWGLYATYTWTARPGIGAWQSARFYVPAIGAIALLGAWLTVQAPRLARWPRRAPLAAAVSATVVATVFTLGTWSFNDMLNPQNPGPPPPPHCNIGEPHCPVTTPPGTRPGRGLLGNGLAGPFRHPATRNREARRDQPAQGGQRQVGAMLAPASDRLAPVT